MRAVLAGDVAELAADAQVAIDVRDDLVIQVEVAPILHVGHGAAAKILDGAIAMRVHVLREAVDHVLDDAETVVHGRGADLHGGGADGDVLGSVIPEADAADAADGQLYRFGDAKRRDAARSALPPGRNSRREKIFRRRRDAA